MPPRLDISLKKFHDLQICTRPTCRGILCDGIRKQKFPDGSIFFLIYKLLKKKCIYKFVNSKKNISGWKTFFCEYHRLEYRNMYVVCKCEGCGIFLSEISSRGAKVPLKMNENIIQFKALPIFLPKRDSWGFSICHS